MELSKILTVVCGFVLAICLVLSITTLVVLRNALDENEALQLNAVRLTNTLGGYVDELNATLDAEDSIPTGSQATETVKVSDGFIIRAAGEKIGVYTADGDLIQLLEVRLDSLPSAERERLTTGIEISSWRELLSLIQDYLE